MLGVKVRDDAMELHEQLIPANPKIPEGKEKYQGYLSQVVGKTVGVLSKEEEGYDIRVAGKKIFLPNEFVEAEVSDWVIDLAKVPKPAEEVSPVYIDPSILKKGDVVYYYSGLQQDDVGTVEGDNLYKDGVDVHGDGWRQYVGKWFIFKVERDGEVLFQNVYKVERDGEVVFED